MAPAVEAVSFDQIIEKDRVRRKNEALAKEIFGKGRKAAVTKSGTRKADGSSSLASRIGVVKASQRSTSKSTKQKGNVEGPWGHDLHSVTNPARAPRVTRPAREKAIVRAVKDDLLYEAATGGQLQNSAAVELNIRGIAGPYTVIGSNFAPGTTAADIESAMLPAAGEMQSCRILTAAPTVMAEMVFAEKEKADLVIATFNNKKADGRILHVYMRQGLPQEPAVAPASPPRKAAVEPRLPPPEPSRNGLSSSSYDHQRESSDRSRRRAEPELQDGSYGFEAPVDGMDLEMEAPLPLGADQTFDRRDEYQNGRRDDRRIDRDDQRQIGNRYEPRNYGRGGHDPRDRNRGGPRLRDERRLYSDDIYRPSRRGSGFR